MKSTQLTTSRSSKAKSIATISKKLSPIPTHQQVKLKGGGNPWIDAGIAIGAVVAVVGVGIFLLNPMFRLLAAAKAREAEFDAALAAWARTRTTDAALAACSAAGIPAGRVQSMAEIAGNPHTWARGMLLELDHPVSGPLKLLGSPFKSDRAPGVTRCTAPAVGQHTREVLAELLGYDDETLNALAEEGVIGLG